MSIIPIKQAFEAHLLYNKLLHINFLHKYGNPKVSEDLNNLFFKL